MDVKNGFAYVFQFLSLISGNLGGVNTVSMVFGFFCKQMAANPKIQITKKILFRKARYVEIFFLPETIKAIARTSSVDFSKVFVVNLYVN